MSTDSRQPGIPWALGLLALALAGAPLSSKVAGALWLCLCLAGAWLAWRPGVAPAPAPLRKTARVWLVACLLGLVCGAVATGLWRSPWDELHAPIRLTLGAAAAITLAGRLQGDPHRRWVRCALAAACIGALGLALHTGGTRTLYPTNAIPWGVAMGFLVCLLVPMLLNDPASRRERVFLAIGAVAGLLAVLLSLSRGAYGILPWVAVLCGWPLWKRRRYASQKGRALGLALAGLVAVVLVSTPLVTPVGPRMLEAAQELEAVIEAPPTNASANTSIGTRVVMWGLAWEGFRESPWLGVGREERLRRIAQVGEQLGAPQLAALRHVHNNYLQAAFDYGLLGVGLVLALLAGLLWNTWRLARCDATAGWQMAGLCFMHATSELTNVNMAHNYYGAMLALTSMLVFALARSRRSLVREAPSALLPPRGARASTAPACH